MTRLRSYLFLPLALAMIVSAPGLSTLSKVDKAATPAQTSSPDSPERTRLYKIIERKVNMLRAEAPTFDSSQKVVHADSVCDMTLTWKNITCTKQYSFNLKDFDPENIGTRISNIYPRITLNVSDKKKRVHYSIKCGDDAPKQEDRESVVFDVKRPGGMEIYRVAAAFIYLIKECKVK